MAARGYWQGFQFVQKGMAEALKGENPRTVVDDDHLAWYGR
jgi:hypothetical protein